MLLVVLILFILISISDLHNFNWLYFFDNDGSYYIEMPNRLYFKLYF